MNFSYPHISSIVHWIFNPKISSGPLIGLLLLFTLFSHPTLGQDDDAEHKERIKRSSKAEKTAQRENAYSGDAKPIKHGGRNNNEVRAGEVEVGRDPSEKSSKKMNSYSGSDRVKASDPSKKSSQKMSNYTGDASVPKSKMQLPRHDSYVPLPTNQAYITSQKIKNYTGDATMRKPRIEAPRHEANYVTVDDKKGREVDKKIAKYDGDIVVNDSKLRTDDKKRANYSGDIVVDNSNIRSEDKKRANYSGDIVVDNSAARVNDKRRANYQGDLPNNYLEKRAAYRQEKSRKMGAYQGDITVKSLLARDRRTRIKSKKIANYEGDIVVRRVNKGMHPSAVYRGGKVKNSYAAKERYRKRILKKYGKNDGLEDANYMKKKYQKPKHDKKEAEIWY